MKVLLHTCCAPCSIECISSLGSEGISQDLFFFNPNIMPDEEYVRRKNTLITYAKEISANLIIHEPTPFEKAGSRLADYLSKRAEYLEKCQGCYDIRLEETASYAKKNDYDAFTTTLLISPYQNHELLIETAERAAKKYGSLFLYRDFRALFRLGQKKAREMQMYMQKYCGCV